jgi:hypothetical protein
MIKPYPFDFFAVLGRGIPLLHCRPIGKSPAVVWGDGSLLDYGLFHAALNPDAMNAMLRRVWDAHQEGLPPRARLGVGGVHGYYLSGAPRGLTSLAYEVVRTNFESALCLMLVCGVGNEPRTPTAREDIADRIRSFHDEKAGKEFQGRRLRLVE